MFQIVVELVLTSLVLVGMTTQIIVPLLYGERLFPFFRGRYSEVEEKLTDISEELKEQELWQRAEELGTRIKQKPTLNQEDRF